MLSQFCIRRPIFASVLSILIVLGGILCYLVLPVSQYPNIARRDGLDILGRRERLGFSPYGRSPHRRSTLGHSGTSLLQHEYSIERQRPYLVHF